MDFFIYIAARAINLTGNACTKGSLGTKSAPLGALRGSSHASACTVDLYCTIDS